MDKYKLELRHRALATEFIPERHERFLAKIAGLDSPWNLAGIGPLPDIGSELLVTVALGKIFGVGVKGRLTYVYRSVGYLEDNAQYDDSLFIEFAPGDISIDKIIEILPVYISGFECYRATLHNWAVTRSDWPGLVEACDKTGRDLNGRDGVYRINVINYFDRELCKRAFLLSPEEIFERLDGKVQSVSLVHDGIFMVYSSKELNRHQFQGVDSVVRSLLEKESGRL